LRDEARYWEARYARGGNSGEGSRGDEVAWKAARIVREIRACGATSVADFGTGDGWLTQLILEGLAGTGVEYTGYDTAPTAVDLARKRVPGGHFEIGSVLDAPIRCADVVLCVDVLFHMSNQERHAAAVASLCAAFKRKAMVITWDARILSLVEAKKRTGWNHYYPVSFPQTVEVQSERVPPALAKTLYVLTRK